AIAAPATLARILERTLLCAAGQQLHEDGEQYDCAADQRPGGRPLPAREPDPDRSKHHFEQGDQPDLPGRDETCPDRQEDQAEPDLPEAEQAAEPEVAAADL